MPAEAASEAAAPMAYGLWPLASGLWPMAYGLWPMAYGLWPMAYGLCDYPARLDDLARMLRGNACESNLHPLGQVQLGRTKRGTAAKGHLRNPGGDCGAFKHESSKFLRHPCGQFTNQESGF